VAAAREFSELVARTMPDVTPAQAAIAWVTQQRGVTTVIPGARNADQARMNAEAALATPPDEFHDGVRAIYDERLRAAIHPRW
jgi:aryl-alcohol dehydrogenase-like predicted oxidoreductase